MTCISLCARRRQTGGFSLLEVLIAMCVLSVGAASLLSLFAAAATTHRRSVDRTHAALVAERIVSELKAAYALGMTPAEVSDAVRARAPEELDGYRWSVRLFHPEGDEWSESELFAEVSIRFGVLDAARAEAFHTVIVPRLRVGEMPK